MALATILKKGSLLWLPIGSLLTSISWSLLEKSRSLFFFLNHKRPPKSHIWTQKAFLVQPFNVPQCLCTANLPNSRAPHPDKSFRAQLGNWLESTPQRHHVSQVPTSGKQSSVFRPCYYFIICSGQDTTSSKPWRLNRVQIDSVGTTHTSKILIRLFF